MVILYGYIKIDRMKNVTDPKKCRGRSFYYGRGVFASILFHFKCSYSPLSLNLLTQSLRPFNLPKSYSSLFQSPQILLSALSISPNLTLCSRNLQMFTLLSLSPISYFPLSQFCNPSFSISYLSDSLLSLNLLTLTLLSLNPLTTV